jgi:hypothetical protein
MLNSFLLPHYIFLGWFSSMEYSTHPPPPSLVKRRGVEAFPLSSEKRGVGQHKPIKSARIGG